MLRAAAVFFAFALTGCIFWPSDVDSDTDTTDGGDSPYLFVAVGDGGTIVRSAGGNDWNVSTSGVSVALNDAAFGFDTWVVVGQAGTILYSSDGIEWAKSSSPSTRDLFAVTWHGDHFVAVGGDFSAGAETLESDDGVTWTRPDLPAPKHLLFDLASNGSTLVAIGSYQADAMHFGAFTWHPEAGWVQRIDGSPTGIRYGALGQGAPNFAMLGPTNTATSGDGITWTNTVLFSLAADPRALTYGPGGWIAVGGSGQILGSLPGDAITWTARTSPVTTDLLGVASDGSRYVGVGVGGQIVHSPDGATWTAVTAPVSADLRGVAHSLQ